jgi:hypothetical protein
MALICWIAMVGSVFMYGGLLYFMERGKPAAAAFPGGFSLSHLSPFEIAVYAAALATLVAAFAMKRMMFFRGLQPPCLSKKQINRAPRRRPICYSFP